MTQRPRQDTAGSRDQPRVHRAFMGTVLAIVALTAGLHVAGAFLLKDSFWGVHFYAFFAPSLLVSATALLLAASLLIAVKSQAVGERLSFGIDLPRLRRFPATIGTVTAAGIAALLWLARSSHTYLGDGNVLVNSIPAGQAFHPRQPLTMLAQHEIYALTGGFFGAGERSGDLVARDTLAFGSVLLGVVFAGVVWLLARELAALRRRAGEPQRDKPEAGARKRDPQASMAFLVALVLLAQGYIQLFFGYVENYTFYALGTGLYLWLSLRYLRGAAPLVLPAGALLLGIALHLSAAVLLPSFAVLAVHGWMTPGRRRGTIRDLLLTLGLLAGIDLAFAAYQPGYHLVAELADVTGMALTRGQEGAPGYMLSTRHLRDFFNEQFLIGPLGIFLFVPAAVTALVKRTGRHAANVYLMVAGAAYLAVSWLAGDSNLGYARNWDLLAPGAPICTAAGLGLFLSLGNGLPGARRAMPVLACAALVSLYHTAPWVATNASSERSFERLKTLPLGLGRTEVLVGKWYSWQGALDDAQLWFEKAVHVNPRNNNAYYLLGLVHWDRGEMPAAAAAFARAVRLRPDKVLFRERLVQALRARERYEETLPHIEFVLEHKPQDVNYWIYYGEALQAVDRQEHANQAFRRAVPLFRGVWELDPDGYRTNYVYGILYGNLDEFEQALPYFETALRAQPDSDAAHYYAGYTLYVLGRKEEAKAHFRRCLDLNPDHPERTDIEKWLQEG
ncbi:MAG: tetratricopeptide repeat protein [Candidatus Krumholzibacteria bacterium]